MAEFVGQPSSCCPGGLACVHLITGPFAARLSIHSDAVIAAVVGILWDWLLRGCPIKSAPDNQDTPLAILAIRNAPILGRIAIKTPQHTQGSTWQQQDEQDCGWGGNQDVPDKTLQNNLSSVALAQGLPFNHRIDHS